VGTEVAGRDVIVGGDVRPSTAALRRSLVEGLMTTGCHVVDIGTVPTPAFYYARDYLGIERGVMVTGSHNPPGDNGFKISLGGWPITEDEIAGLARRIELGQFAQGAGTCEQREVIGSYERSVGDPFIPGDRLRVVVDAGNGCYSEIAPRVLQAVGYEIVPLFCAPDGRFPNRSPNPAIAENLRTLRRAVTASGADAGVAYDGDGDRVVFVDERGRIVSSDQSIVLFARHLLQGGPGEVVYDIKCSSVVADEVRGAGGVPVMEKSGHAFIKTTLLERQAVLGGEISGHFFFGQLGRDDGLYATLLMLQLTSQSGTGLAALADGVPQYPITPDIRLPCSPDESTRIMHDLLDAFDGRARVEVSRLDGVRIAWPDGWGLARPSVTEPLITLRFEGRTEERLAEIVAVVVAGSADLARLMTAHGALPVVSR
jgi:phosphomannomutase/phosphoglucomutase